VPKLVGTREMIEQTMGQAIGVGRRRRSTICW